MTRQLQLGLLAVLALSAPSIADDAILDWNFTLSNAIRENATRSNPGWASRAMAMSNGAMYDVYMAFDPTHESFKYSGDAPIGASRDAALSQAAYETMLACYPDQQATLETALAMRLSAVPDGAAKDAGIQFGKLVAETYIDWRTADGADTTKPYVVDSSPGHWDVDPQNPDQNVWGPEWGAVKTFALPDSGHFDLPGPPPLNSQAYAEAYNEVLHVGAKDSTSRTQEQTNIGNFWAYDRQSMGPPPVLYNSNLRQIAEQMGNTEADNARLFAMASVALADAAVASWDAKFEYDLWRPITAIRRGDEDGNPLTVPDTSWVPLGAPGADPLGTDDNFTPPFPAYTSGHATFGGALYETLRLFYDSDAPQTYYLTSDEMPDDNNIRYFNDFTSAEWENAISRLYLGIHWRFDAVDGIALGNSIADYVHVNHFQAIPETSSVFLAGGLAVSFLLITLSMKRNDSRAAA